MCSVLNCDSERRSAQRFKLPEDPETRLLWVQFLLEVNEQKLKESDWTEITICREHFTADSFNTPNPLSATAELKSGAVPSMCIKTEPQEPEENQVPGETTDDAFQWDPVKKSESPSPPNERYGQVSPVPNNSSEAPMYDYVQMIQQVADIDIIREKVALLQIKGNYIVNENRLLQLFTSKCPLCGSKVKTEKFTYGALIVMSRQCLQCEYRHQWKSQANASIPTDEHEQLTGGTEVFPEMVKQEDHSCITGASDEESDIMDQADESDDEVDSEVALMENVPISDSDEESDSEEDDGNPVTSENGTLCTDCGGFFIKRKRHVCDKKMAFSCNVCGKKYISEAALGHHRRIHDENYEHLCKFCHATLKTKLQKVVHVRTHKKDPKPYKCLNCSQSFATKRQRRMHCKINQGPPEHSCKVCAAKFHRFSALKRHLKKLYRCSMCIRSFDHTVSLERHVQRCHMADSGGKKRKKITSSLATEDNHISTTGASGVIHVLDEESDATEETQDSDDGDSDSDWKPTEDVLLENELLGDSEEEGDGNPRSAENTQLCTDCGKHVCIWKPHTCEHTLKPLSCNTCGKRLTNEVALHLHSKIHDVNYEHPCKFCCVTFNTKQDKITHEQTHVNDAKPYKCPECLETFATNKQRRVHCKIHGDPKHLKCDICGVQFYGTSSLNRHLAVHTGEKPFKCSVCDRGFTQEGNLKSHMRLHTGERPYKCQHCDKSFNHNVSLKSHVQRYHTCKKNTPEKDDTGLYSAEGGREKQKKRHRKRSSGRPVGRPKKNSKGNLSAEIESQCSDKKSAKVKRVVKKKKFYDEESEDELNQSETSSDQTEEEEMTRKVKRS